jgi:hypothetical protein
MIQPLSQIDATLLPHTPALVAAQENIVSLFPDVYLFETTDGRFQLRTPRSKNSPFHMILCEDSERSPYLWMLALDTQTNPETRRRAFTEASVSLSDESEWAMYFRAIRAERLMPIATMTDNLNGALALLSKTKVPSIPSLLRRNSYEYEAGLIEAVITLYNEARRIR